ncbi:MAG: FKBP-type peptidyl-prolyl cis-trans isomerase [bacterium]|jgi:FKBP-type peptidyl-prolyl cis-trans isomerase FkpA
MIRKILFVVAIVFAFSTSFAQKVKYKTDKSGSRYFVVKSNKTPLLKLDDVVTLQLKYTNTKDSVLFDSWKMGGPLQLKVTKPQFKGDLMSGLVLLHVGDSASFLINADSLFTKTFNMSIPEFIEKGSDLKFTVKVIKSIPEVELKAEEIKTQKQKDMQETIDIEKYIKENNLTVVTTASGLKYVMLAEGTGEQAQAGKSVRVHYTGKLLDGTKFDSSLDRNDPLEFMLGQGMVIRGWDEGIALLKVGGKALLIIPSNLAYGARGAGNVIPPFSPLTFEVELVEVK